MKDGSDTPSGEFDPGRQADPIHHLGRSVPHLSRRAKAHLPMLYRRPAQDHAGSTVVDVATVAAFLFSVILGVVTGFWTAIPLGVSCTVAAWIGLRHFRVRKLAWVLLSLSAVATALTYSFVDALDDSETVVPSTGSPEMNCPIGTNGPELESSIGVANVTSGDVDYANDVFAEPGDVVKLQAYLRNMSVTQDIENLILQMQFDEEALTTSLISIRTCGSNTDLVRDSVTVRRAGGGRIRLLPEAGSVRIRSTFNGAVVDRIGSDVLFGPGESLGQLRGASDDDMTVTVLAVVATS